jgi:hypothetical protein
MYGTVNTYSNLESGGGSFSQKTETSNPAQFS